MPSTPTPDRTAASTRPAPGSTRGAPDSTTGGTPQPSEPVDQQGTSTSSGQRRLAKGTRFVFIDTEATGLDHQRHELTEVAWIVRLEDGSEVERQYFPQHTVDGADADALDLTQYDERIAPRDKTPASEWLTTFLADATDAVIVGAVPDFDTRHLERMCRKLGLEPTWDHHLLDVETLALPLIAPGAESPRSLAKTCAALGIPHDKDRAHGALYDAQQAKRVFDRVWELVGELRATQAPLPPPVPRDANGNSNGGEGDSGNGGQGGTGKGAGGVAGPGERATSRPSAARDAAGGTARQHARAVTDRTAARDHDSAVTDASTA